MNRRTVLSLPLATLAKPLAAFIPAPRFVIVKHEEPYFWLFNKIESSNAIYWTYKSKLLNRFISIRSTHNKTGVSVTKSQHIWTGTYEDALEQLIKITNIYIKVGLPEPKLEIVPAFRYNL